MTFKLRHHKRHEDYWSDSGQIQIQPFSGKASGGYLRETHDLVGLSSVQKGNGFCGGIRGNR